MFSFENFVKSMPLSSSELKVTPSFCFAFKIPDARAVISIYADMVGGWVGGVQKDQKYADVL